MALIISWSGLSYGSSCSEVKYAASDDLDGSRLPKLEFLFYSRGSELSSVYESRDSVRAVFRIDNLLVRLISMEGSPSDNVAMCVEFSVTVVVCRESPMFYRESYVENALMEAAEFLRSRDFAVKLDSSFSERP